MLHTTLNKIKAHSPCSSGWRTLLKHLGKTTADDEPLSFLTILESNGRADAIWAMRSAPEYAKEWRLFAVWCARSCQPKDADPRSIAAIDCAERFANGNATAEELAAYAYADAYAATAYAATAYAAAYAAAATADAATYADAAAAYAAAAYADADAADARKNQAEELRRIFSAE